MHDRSRTYGQGQGHQQQTQQRRRRRQERNTREPNRAGGEIPPVMTHARTLAGARGRIRWAASVACERIIISRAHCCVRANALDCTRAQARARPRTLSRESEFKLSQGSFELLLVSVSFHGPAHKRAHGHARTRARTHASRRRARIARARPQSPWTASVCVCVCVCVCPWTAISNETGVGEDGSVNDSVTGRARERIAVSVQCVEGSIGGRTEQRR